jgi:hypothetical protein
MLCCAMTPLCPMPERSGPDLLASASIENLQLKSVVGRFIIAVPRTGISPSRYDSRPQVAAERFCCDLLRAQCGAYTKFAR